MKLSKSLHLMSIVTLFAFVFAALTPSVAFARTTEKVSPIDVALAVNAETGEFSTLIAALVYTDLAGKLDNAVNFTVFAPTDAAFAALGLNAENITSLPKETLKGILLYHVAGGTKYASFVVQQESLKMKNGMYAPITVNENGAFIAGAQIVAVDIKSFGDVTATRGVIHVISSVMLP